MTIAQIVWDNEKAFGYSDDDILAKVAYLPAWPLQTTDHP